jgi:hypothetical protein
MPPSSTRYAIIRAGNTHLLAAALQPVLADGVWECSGGPFHDPQRSEWCQAVVRKTAPPTAGEVNLREPRRK